MIWEARGEVFQIPSVSLEYFTSQDLENETFQLKFLKWNDWKLEQFYSEMKNKG